MSIIDDIISSAQGQNQSGSSGQTPFDRAADFTLDNEGSALVPDDAGKGPSKFGINKTANPDVDVPNLTRDAAKALYKQRYWNGINGDRLAEVNPDLALVAHDVAATAGVRRANQMVAQSGGDPNKLLQLRQEFLDSLVAANPQKFGQYANGWAARGDRLAAQIGGDQSQQGQQSGQQARSPIRSSDQYGDLTPTPSPTVMDYVKHIGGEAAKNIVGGALESVGQVGAGIANRVTDTQDYVGKNPLDGMAKSLDDSMTPGGKAAAQDGFTGNIFDGTLQAPKTTAGMAMSIGSTLGTLGGFVASMFIPGVGPVRYMRAAEQLNEAAKAASLAGDAARAADLAAQAASASRAANIANSAAGVLQTYGPTAEASRKYVDSVTANMSHDELMNIPAYRDTFNQTGDDNQAKNAVSNNAAELGGALASLPGMYMAHMSNKLVNSAITGNALPAFTGSGIGNMAGRVATTGASGAIGGAAGMTGVTMAQNAGENMALNQPATQDIGRNTGPAAVAGAIMGGVPGAMAGIRSPNPIQQAAAQPNSPLSRAVSAAGAASPSGQGPAGQGPSGGPGGFTPIHPIDPSAQAHPIPESHQLGIDPNFDPNTIDVPATDVSNRIGLDRPRLPGPDTSADDGSGPPPPTSGGPSDNTQTPSPEGVSDVVDKLSQPPGSTDGTQATQAQQTEAQGSQAPGAAAPVKPRTQVPFPTELPTDVTQTSPIGGIKARIGLMVDRGFDTVETKADGSTWLVNNKTNEETPIQRTYEKFVKDALNSRINDQAHEAPSSPLNDKTETQAQIDANNRLKPSVTVNGETIRVENPQGATRSGVGPDGKPWSTTMQAHYGEIQGTKGADGDPMDAFIGPNPQSNKVFVIDQTNKDGTFDEHKVMFGYKNEADARQGYLNNYEPGWTGLGGITEMTPEQFRQWSRSDAAQHPLDSRVPEAPSTDPIEQKRQAIRQQNVQDLNEANGNLSEWRSTLNSRLASETDPRARARIQSQLDKIPQLNTPPDDALHAFESMRNAMSSLTGKKLVGYWDERGVKQAADGFQLGDKQYINLANPRLPIQWSVGHEFEHLNERLAEMGDKRSQELRDHIWSLISNDGKRKYYEQYLRPGESFDNARDADLAHLKKEMLADFMGKRFMDKEWLSDLAKKQPGLFGSFVSKWLPTLDKAIKALKGYIDHESKHSKNVDQWITQLKEAKAHATELAIRWAKAHQEAARENGLDDLLNSARDGLTDEERRDLQDELDAANGIKPSAYKPTATQGAIKAAGLRAEEAYPQAQWKIDSKEAEHLDFDLPNGRRETAGMERAGDGWRGDVLNTWIGNVGADFSGFATKDGVKSFIGRQIAGLDLAARNFDLADTQPLASNSKIVDAWNHISSLDGSKKFEKPSRSDQSLNQIAVGMGLDKAYDVSVSTEKLGPNDKTFVVRFTNKQTGDPSIAFLNMTRSDGRWTANANTSSLDRSGVGAAFYQMAAEYAARNNVQIAPEGSLSGINSYRRTEQMLSAALRTGKSNVMVPHESQRLYGFVNNATRAEDHRDNVARMLLAGVRNAKELVPKFDELHYDPAMGAFFDKDGNQMEQVVTKALKSKDARALGMGRSTLARAVMTNRIMDGSLDPKDITSLREPITYSARDDADAEYEAVRARYQGTPQWMKAPNGQQTKLAQRQWIQVRTPSFKKWFGDWEKFAGQQGGVWRDSKREVSKAVDENGEPMVLYHGTGKGGFTKFDTPSGRGRGDLGIFLTDNESMADSYVRRGRANRIDLSPKDQGELENAGFDFETDEDGRVQVTATDGYPLSGPGDDGSFPSMKDAVEAANRELDDGGSTPGVYAVFANIRNPLEENFEGANWNGSRSEQWVVNVGGEHQTDASGRMYFDDVDDARELARSFLSPEQEEEGFDPEEYVKAADDHHASTDDVVKEARSVTHDGAIIRDVRDDGGGPGYDGEPSAVVVALKPDQVKSADHNTGEFGADTDDLRYSQRERDFDDPNKRIEVSTTVPTAKRNGQIISNAVDHKWIIDAKDIESSKTHLEAAERAIRNYNSVDLKGKASAARALMDTIVSNLMWLHDIMPKEVRARAKLWYDGANRIAHGLSDKFGIDLRQASGVLAVLSPQKDWFMNTSLGERVISIVKRHGDEKWSPAMTDWVKSYIGASKTVDERDARKPMLEFANRLEGKTLNSMDLRDAARFVRVFDETYYPRKYRVVTPEGGFGEFVENAPDEVDASADDVEPGSVAWGSYPTIEKAISILRDNNPETMLRTISEALGGEHKVRNFYNNIVSPNSADGHVTIDTHAIAAGLMKALSGSSMEVLHNFGSTPKGMEGAGANAASGASGIYGFVADAYREAAGQLFVLPRELQSITWEAIRSIFLPKFKSKRAGDVEDIFNRYQAGELTYPQARQMAYDLGGGIKTLPWENTPAGHFVQDGGSSFDSDIADNPADRAVRLLDPVNPRDKISVGLSAYTSAIPGVKALRDLADKGDLYAQQLLQDIALDHLKHLTAGTSAKIRVDRVAGLYGGEFEPSLGLSISFEDQDRAKVLAALAKFGENFKQHQVHVRKGTKAAALTEFPDGSYATPVYRWSLNRALARSEIQDVIDQSGLYGLTFGDDFVEAYFYNGVNRSNKTYEQQVQRGYTTFLANAQKVAGLLGKAAGGVQETIARLWPYGHGHGAIGYDTIRGDISTGPHTENPTARRVAEYLNAVNGKPGSVPVFKAKDISKAQDKLQSKIADAFDELPVNDLANPLVAKAYNEAAQEIKRQYLAMPVSAEVQVKRTRSGRIVKDANGTPIAAGFDGGEPYKSSDDMRRDVLDNNRIKIYGTDKDTFGPPGEDFSHHPLLQQSGLKDPNGYPLTYNDLLRAVHDYYAHTMSPTQFGPKGEEAAWKNHMAMTMNPWARWAITTETRGQNSWVNFNRRLDRSTPISQRSFAEQKAALLPIHYAMTGNAQVDAPMQALAKELADAGQIPQYSSRGQTETPKNDEPFYSELSRKIVDAPIKNAAPGAWKQYIKGLTSKGVKPDEIEWSGVNDFLDMQQGKVSKEQVQEFLDGNGVKVTEVMLGGDHAVPAELQKYVDHYGGDTRTTSGLLDIAREAEQDARRAQRRGDPSKADELFSIAQLANEHAELGETGTGATKYAQYTLLGGENYREVLLTLPTDNAKRAWHDADIAVQDIRTEYRTLLKADKDAEADELKPKLDSAIAKRDSLMPTNYMSSHWDGQPNVLAHIRLNDRTDADGKRVLFVEELQSDWGQEGHKKGFMAPDTNAQERAQIQQKMSDLQAHARELRSSLKDSYNTPPIIAEMESVRDQINALDDRLKEIPKPTGLPVAPFVTKTEGWLNLALKRVIKMAVDEGYDKVAFIDGQQSTDRYWGHELVQPAVSRWNEISKPYGVREELLHHLGGELASVSPLKVMDVPVLLASKNNQIGRAVVEAIPINVVNILSKEGLSADQLVRQPKVVGERLPVDHRATVAAGLASATKLVGARLRAALLRVLSSESGRGDEELLPAVRASDLVPKEVMRLLADLGSTDLGRDVGVSTTGGSGARDGAKATMPLGGVDLAGESPKLRTAELAKALNRHAEIVARQTGNPVEYVQEPPGEGMKAFYDKIVPAALKPLLKKLGGGPLETVEFGSERLAVQHAPGGDGFMIFDKQTKQFYRGGNSGSPWVGNQKNAKVFLSESSAKKSLPEISGSDNRLEQPGFTITDKIRASAEDGLPLFSARDQTETPEFKRWFDDSKVVDADGKPMVVYHGTAADFSKFKTSKNGLFGTGIYFTSDAAEAEEFSFGKDGGERVIPVYLSLKRPYRVRAYDSWADVYEDVIGREPKNYDDEFPTDKQAKEMKATLEEMGHDGLVVRGPDGTHFVAFHPEQIKSAIGNNGEFDPTNPDIRYSQRAPGATWDSPETSRFDDLLYKLQDKHIDMKRVIESIKKAGAQIRDDLNTYLQEELFHGRTAKRVEDFAEQELKPLFEQMKDDGLSMEDVEEYLHARHAQEANDVIAQRNPGDPNLQDGGSGMTNADAARYMNSLTPEMRAKLEDAADKVDAIIAKTRQTYADYNLESQATVDGWGQMFQHYVPLMREAPEGDATHGFSIGQGFSIKGKETKGRTGSTRKVVDILANVAMQRERAIVRGEKNRIAEALMGLAAANPNSDFWTVGSPPTQRVFDPKTGTVVDQHDPMFKNRANAVVAKVKDAWGNVVERAVLFNENNARAMRMAGAIKNLDAGSMEGLWGVSAKLSRYFSAINTHYNPFFGFVHLSRSIQEAMVNIADTPLHGQQGKIAKMVVPAIRGVFSGMRNAHAGNAPRNQWEQLWDQFQQDGGQTGYRESFSTSQDRAEALQKMLTPDAWMDSKLGKIFTANGTIKAPYNVARKSLGYLGDALHAYNAAMENGTRLAAYKAALDSGMTRQQAASLAKNLTINFNRKGAWGQQAGALYAFFNATMQGTARMANTMFTMEGGQMKNLRLTKVGKAVILGGLLLGSMQAFAMQAAGFNEDDPPEYVRQRSMVIPIGGGKYVTIPMPQGYSTIPYIGQVATEYALSGFKDGTKRVTSVLSKFAESYNPIGTSSINQTIAPTAIDPIVALAENKGMNGRPIARISDNKNIPGFSQWKDNATPWGKFIAEAINTLSGGSHYSAGALSPTPDQIDYLLGEAAGGIGREGGKIAKAASAVSNGESVDVQNLPGVGRFYGNTQSAQNQSGEFYAAEDRMKALETEFNLMNKDGKRVEAQALLRSRPEAYLLGQAKSAERQVQELHKQKRALIEADAPREQIKAIEDKTNAVMVRFNTAMSQLQHH